MDMEDDFKLKGKIFTPLFDKNIEVVGVGDVDDTYIRRCENNLIGISKDTINYIYKRIHDYYTWWIEEEISKEEVAEIRKKIPDNVDERDILKFISEPKMYIFEPENTEILAYTIICQYCEWEKEQGVQIIIRDNDVVYVGCGGNGFFGWEDVKEYEVDY